MTWTLRHQGSPRQVPGLSPAQIVEGLQDGEWEPTDEVRGPEDADWVSLEDHPRFAEIVADLESPASEPVPDSETHLDMNALIDVTLVLLIFFILTTSYEVLEKVLAMPQGMASEERTGVKDVSQQDVDNFMIRVEARPQGAGAVVSVEGQSVPEGELQTTLRRFAREKQKTTVLLDAAGVDYGTVIKIIDAAGGAKIDRVNFLARPK